MDLDSDDWEFYGERPWHYSILGPKPVDNSNQGSPDKRRQLEDRVDDFDASAWLDKHRKWGFGCPSKYPVSPSLKSAKLHNPYAGKTYAWQLTESLDDFFARLPPDSTRQTDKNPWIYICNPFVARAESQDEDADVLKGNEDEAPREDGRQLRLVVQGGLERLDLLADLTRRVTASGRSQAFVGRELFQERRRASADILGLAYVGRVRSGKVSAGLLMSLMHQGHDSTYKFAELTEVLSNFRLKWMLFCPPTSVSEVWETVARATANNELGIAAKVAPHADSGDPLKERIICVYTADFKDKTDVSRVLQRLRELRLVGSAHRPIYYKPDIYTYIGIAGGNPWGLAASIYSSSDFLPDA